MSSERRAISAGVSRRLVASIRRRTLSDEAAGRPFRGLVSPAECRIVPVVVRLDDPLDELLKAETLVRPQWSIPRWWRHHVEEAGLTRFLIDCDEEPLEEVYLVLR